VMDEAIDGGDGHGRVPETLFHLLIEPIGRDARAPPVRYPSAKGRLV
jgi:hypothetical protein